VTLRLLPIIAISLGASLGAVLRWQLSEHLNHRLAHLPLGTLAANWIGAYAIGLAVAYFSDAPRLSEEWRLFLITGLLGGLTTFSTFSAEVVQLLQQGRWLWAGIEVSSHLLGSLIFTLLGLATYAVLR
jgi:CrcB protein